MRRMFGGLMAASLLLSAAPALSAGGGAAGLSDIGGHWAKAYIEEGVGAGYVAGFPDGTFKPDQPITRAEFLKLLTAAMGQPAFPGAYSGFTQGTDHWAFAQGHVQAAVRSGLLFPPDYGADLGADVPIKRQEIVLATVRALGKSKLVDEQNAVLKVPDAASYAAWLKGWAAAALSDGIVTGYEDGSLGLERTATRAEALVMVQRVLAKVTASVAAEQAPVNETSQRWPAAGEPEWRLVDPWAPAPVISDGTSTYRLPGGARGLMLMAAPGKVAYLRYVVDGASTDIMYDVIVKLHDGKLEDVFRAQFTGDFRYLVGVSPDGRVYFADGKAVKVGGNGTVSTLATLPDRSGLLFPAADGSFWTVSPENAQQLLHILADGTVQAMADGLTPGQRVDFVAPGADGAVWLLASDSEGIAEARLVRDGQMVKRLPLMDRYVAGNDPMSPAVVGVSGDGLYLARQTRTGEYEWKASGYFRFDLATGAFRPVVLPRTAGAGATLVTAPDGGALARDAAGKYWRILP